MIKRFRESTVMDQQGRIFVNSDLRKIMGLQNGGPVEFFINGQGEAVIRAANRKSAGRKFND